jgi:hypothetical protein
MSTVKIRIPQNSPKGMVWKIVEVDAELAKRELSKPNLKRNSGFRNAELVVEAVLPKEVEVKKAETITEKVAETAPETETEVKPKRTRKK